MGLLKESRSNPSATLRLIHNKVLDKRPSFRPKHPTLWPASLLQHDESHYLFIEDESGNPLATALTFRVSTPKVKKMYNKFAEQLAKKRGLKKAKDLGEQGKRVAGERLLDHLRTLGPRSAKERQVTMQPLTLVRIDVQLEDGEFIKERSVVVRNY